MANASSRSGSTLAAHLLYVACCAVVLISISVPASAQEQSEPPQIPSPQNLPTNSGQSAAQEESKPLDASVEPERWNLFYQATSIGDEHGTFHAPYEGPLSLQDYTEHDVSLTTTLFFLGARLERQHRSSVFDPEIAGGKGFSGVDGIANPPNGEIPRVATATPKPYIARLFIAHDFGFGAGERACRERRQPTRGRTPDDALLHLRGPVHGHRFFRQQRLYSRSAHAVHGLGRDVQRRLGLSGRYARLHLGPGAGVAHAQLGISLRHRGGAGSPTARNSTAACSAITARRSKSSAAIRWSMRRRAAPLGYANRADAGTYADALRSRRRRARRPDVVATRRAGNAEVRHGSEPGAGDHARRRRFLAARLERRQDRELSLSPPSTGWRAAAYPSKARAGSGKTTSRPLRYRQAASPACMRLTWRAVGWTF